MIDITFPDGSVRSFEDGVTGYQIAEGISPRFAADVLAMTIKTPGSTRETAYDLDRPREFDTCKIQFLMQKVL